MCLLIYTCQKFIGIMYYCLHCWHAYCDSTPRWWVWLLRSLTVQFFCRPCRNRERWLVSIHRSMISSWFLISPAYQLIMCGRLWKQWWWKRCMGGSVSMMPALKSLEKTTSVQVMDWCCQALSHYLSQCRPRSMLPFGGSDLASK